MLPFGATCTLMTSPHLRPLGPFMLAGRAGQSGARRYGFGRLGLATRVSPGACASAITASDRTSTASTTKRTLLRSGVIIAASNQNARRKSTKRAIRRSADFLATHARRRLRIITIGAPGGMAEMDDEIAVTRDDGIVERKRPDLSPVLEGASLAERRTTGRPLVRHFDVERQ